MTFPSTDTCSDNIASVQTGVMAACTGCTAVATCANGMQTVRVWGPSASLTALQTAVRNGQVAGVPPTATIDSVAVSPSGTVTPSSVSPSAPVSTTAYVRVVTLTSVTCATQAQCTQSVQAASPTGTYVVTCTCSASRTGVMNVILAPGSAVDPAAFAAAVASYFNTCVNAWSPQGTLLSTACPKKQSKKGLLGLLGLLGLIPLFLVLLLCCLCCLRRRKTSRDVHFATFDPAPPNVAMAPVPSVCAPAPCLPASVCAPAPICAP